MKSQTFLPGLIVLVVLLVGVFAVAENAPDKPAPTEVVTPKVEVSPELEKQGRAAFGEVYRVLLHPRCMNCHPDGDEPLQTDQSLPHKMNIGHQSTEAGLECAACHQTQNSEALGVVGGPPGAPHWGLPDRDTPLIFQGRTPAQLCAQLKNPQENGNRTLQDLLHHVSKDALVLWGWSPGGNRTVPPLSHPQFVEQFQLWVDSNGACPE